MNDNKATNPKDAIAGTRLPLDLVPPAIEAYAALSFLEGALKYGKYNWRRAGVRSSVYIGAIRRHLSKFQDGEWADPKTKVPHLSSILASVGILLDARLCGKLTDDRGPAAPLSPHIDEAQALVVHLKELFKDHSPHQHTIGDEYDDTGRQGQADNRLPDLPAGRVATQARAKRNGKAGARLPRMPARAVRRGRS